MILRIIADLKISAKEVFSTLISSKYVLKLYSSATTMAVVINVLGINSLTFLWDFSGFRHSTGISEYHRRQFRLLLHLAGDERKVQLVKARSRQYEGTLLVS